MKNGKKGVHDPTIIRSDKDYYLYSTDTTQPKTSGVPIRHSKDLITWDFVQPALEGVPSAAKKWANATGLWAPEVIKIGTEYRMYYSASTFGSTTSFIGLAIASHPLGPWEDRGEVIKTSADIATHNAIDANICCDREGQQWMVYGSFFGGIYIARLDEKTGKLSNQGFGKRIALRSQSVEGAIEGPFIYYNPTTDYFYLFVSYDSLSDFYNIRVARSASIDGPYLDFQGNELTDVKLDPDTVGTKILGGYQFKQEEPLYAPGHNSIFSDSLTGRDYLVHHVRHQQYSEEFSVQVRPLFWLENGWPVTAPYEYTGKVENVIPSDLILKDGWEVVMFNAPTVQESILIECLGEFLSQTNSHYICYQDEKKRVYLTGMTNQGITFFGKKAV